MGAMVAHPAHVIRMRAAGMSLIGTIIAHEKGMGQAAVPVYNSGGGTQGMRWQLRETDSRVVALLARDASLPRPLAAILAGRGITTPAQARVFFEPRIADLHNPLLMDEMEAAVRRLLLAAERGERILLFGDYDVDGITSTAAMGTILETLGLAYSFCHPDRFGEGYGFNRRAVRIARERGAGLIIALDCGTEAAGPVAEARAAGIDVIVIDHHLQSDELPPANAVVNPKKERCPYPFEGLVTAALVLKFARALVERHPLPMPWEKLLQLAALGTVADVVAPLRDENRIIATLGLAALNRNPIPGLRALIAAAGVRAPRLGASHLAFQLAPRLNAAGRIGAPERATRLLLESDETVCASLAGELDILNRERQAIERKILDEALGQIEKGAGIKDRKVLVVAGEGWHRGVVGIVAARILERYHRPAVVIALDGGHGHGSARSIPSFDLFGALSRCRELFSAFGGHRHAAGLSLPVGHIDLFREKINDLADELLTEEDLIPSLTVDAMIDLGEINFEFLRALERVEPCGAGNPMPVFACRGVRAVDGPRAMGKTGAHVRFTVAPAAGRGAVLECVGWNMAGRLPSLTDGLVDIAFSPRSNEWNGLMRIQLVIKDISQYGDTLSN
ncbi:MAG: single-stranded-DNA-specific exonuclease RecJ [Candidatus Aureabacteria bacterium]|nr:single-stranded-DNA-specific exonuclease RecJ [Candidatus Auribacterota bacterium]